MIRILGTRGEIKETSPKHKKYSGVLVGNVLFDIGESEYLKLNPKAIIISHLHPDHAYFVRKKGELHPELKGKMIFSPESLKDFVENHIPIIYKKLKSIKIDGMNIIPIPTTHSKKVKSFAMLIKYKGKKILYTSDMIWINKRYHPLIKNCDLVITEGSFMKKGGMIRRDPKTGEVYGHQGIPNLVNLFKRLGAKQVVFTHFGTWMIKNPKKGYEKIKELGNDIKVWAAKDGEKIELEELLITTEDIPRLLKVIIMKIKERVCPFCNKILPSDEALKEHIKKEHPEEYSRLKEYLSKPKRGLYLVAPHGSWIADRSKTLIVKKRKFEVDPKEPLYLIEKNVAYGIIRLEKPREIGPEEFKELAQKHKVSEKERKKWWGEAWPLYAYEFKFSSFKEPKPVKIPRGVQTFVDAKNIEFLKAEELIVGWIEDYDVKSPNDRQLGDDYRICVLPDTPVVLNPTIEFISEVEPHSSIKEVLKRNISEEVILLKPRYLLPVIFTKEHPIFSLPLSHWKSNGKVVPAYSTTRSRKKKGQFSWKVSFEKPNWKKAEDLKIFDGVAIPKLPTKDIKVSNEYLELAGWYVAEGFPNKTTNVRFSLSKDEENIAQRLKELVRILTGKNCAWYKILEKEIRVEFYNKRLRERLLSDFGAGARNKTVPKWLLEAKVEQIQMFLDSYFKGDGWETGNYLKARTASKKLVIGLWLLNTKLGFMPSLSLIDRETNFGKFLSYEISISKKPRRGSFYEDESYYWLPITKKEILDYSGPVFNLETDSQTYCVPFVVHNCLGWYSSLKRGKKLFKRVGKEKAPISLKDCRDLALKIFKEMIHRGFTFDHPDSYKKYSRELFVYLIRKIGIDKVPWKKSKKPKAEELSISDWKTYNPLSLAYQPNGKYVIGNDHRILHTWWNKLQKGQRMKSKQFSSYSLEEQKEIVKDLHEKIVRAFEKIGWKHRTPMAEESLIGPPEKIRVQDLEEVDDRYISGLSDKEVRILYRRLHWIYHNKLRRITEPLYNAHVFVFKALKRRNIRFKPVGDRLDKETKRIVFEYPKPVGLEKHSTVPEIFLDQLSKEMSLEEVLNLFPDLVVLEEDPVHVYLCGGVVNREKALPGHDVDILFKQRFPDARIIHQFVDEISMRDKDFGRKLHFVWDPCLGLNEKVLTNNGLKSASNIKIGEIVHSASISTVTSVKKISSIGPRYLIKTVKIEPKIVSESHPFLVSKRVQTWRKTNAKHWEVNGKPYWKLAKDLEPGELLLIKKPEDGFYPAYFDLADFLPPNAILGKSKLKLERGRKTSHVPVKTINGFLKYQRSNPVKRIIKTDENFFKFLGWYIAEGDNNAGIEITLNRREKKEAQEIQHLIASVFGLKSKVYERKNNSICITAHSMIVSRFLEFLVGKGASSKFLPLWILSVPKGKIKCFILNWLRGDGHIKSKGFSICSTSPHLRAVLRLLLIKFGIVPSLDGPNLGVKGHKVFRIIKDHHYRPKTKVVHNFYHEDETFVYLPILKVERLPKGEVINIETDNHLIGLPFVTHNSGPTIGMSVPLYRLAFKKVTPREMRRTSPYEYLGQKIRVMKPYRMLKPKSGFHKHEFFDVQEFWDKWGAKNIDKGLIVQKKYDGMRFQVHVKGNQIKIITEDKLRDRSSMFVKSVKELLAKKTANNFVLDAEMVEYNCFGKEVKDKEQICKSLKREKMIPWVTVTRKKLDDENIVFHIHDCVFFNGEDIHEKGYEERWNTIRKCFPPGLRHWRRVESTPAKTVREFFKAVRKERTRPGSEGVVVKIKDSIYKMTGRTAEWAKLKNLKEIDVMVWDIMQKKTKAGVKLQQWIYYPVFLVPCKMKEKIKENQFIEWKGKCYAKIGRAYGTKVKCTRGDIITVRPVQIVENKDPKTGKIFWSVAPDRVIPIKRGNNIFFERIEDIFKNIKSKVIKIGVHEAKKVTDLETLSFKDNKAIWTPIEGISRHKTNPSLVKLNQPLGETIVTKGHSIYSSEGKLVKAEENPEFLAIRKIQRLGEKDGYLGFKGEKLLALMRLFGAYCSEGSSGKNQTSWRIRISNDNKAWLESLAEDFKTLWRKKTSWERTNNTWNLVVWDKALVEFFEKECGKGAKKKKIPSIIFKLKEEYQREFLKVLSEGDGILGKGLSSSSKYLLGGVGLLYAMLGQNFSFYISGREEEGVLNLYPVKHHKRGSRRRIKEIPFKGWSYDLQTKTGNFVDSCGLVVLHNTWMFPFFEAKKPEKKVPDTITTVRRIVKVGTAPLPEQLEADLIIRLPKCPYWNDPTICPLRDRFYVPRRESLTVLEEYLKFPIVCRFANRFKCRFVKPYYYDLRPIRDDSLEIGEEDEE